MSRLKEPEFEPIRRKSSVTEPGPYFETPQRIFASCAASQDGPFDRDYLIAGHEIRLRFASRSLANLITPALAHLLQTIDSVRPFEVAIWDQHRTAMSMPATP